MRACCGHGEDHGLRHADQARLPDIGGGNGQPAPCRRHAHQRPRRNAAGGALPHPSIFTINDAEMITLTVGAHGCKRTVTT
jgi:hypothetical protein